MNAKTETKAPRKPRNTPEAKAKIAAYNARYALKHKQELAARSAEYRAKNPGRMAAYTAKYREENKERIASRTAAYGATYRATYTAADKEKIAAKAKAKYTEKKAQVAAEQPPNPAPDEIRAARESAGLTQTAAATLIYCGLKGWQEWEAGNRKMHPAHFELFRIKTGRK